MKTDAEILAICLKCEAETLRVGVADGLPEFVTGVYQAIYRRAFRDGAEAAAGVCDADSASYGGVAAGPMATERGKLVHECMAVGALNCAVSIREELLGTNQGAT